MTTRACPPVPRGARRLLSALAVALVACGTGERADQREPEAAEPPDDVAAPPAVLDWLVPDPESGTALIDIVAARASDDRWTLNGLSDGMATIHVPEDTRVTVRFRNGDSAYRHSLAATDADPGEGALRAVAGAATPYATDSNRATPPGGADTMTFAATRVGRYALACLVPGHAAAGEWLHLAVTPHGPIAVTVDSA